MLHKSKVIKTSTYYIYTQQINEQILKVSLHSAWEAQLQLHFNVMASSPN